MNPSNKNCYEFGPFFLDGKERLLLRDGQSLNLTPKAFETLLFLVENNGHVLTKQEMLDQLWPDTFVEEANLTNNISLLRRVLGDESESQQFIHTVPKVGYRFVADVKPGRVATNDALASKNDPERESPGAAALPEQVRPLTGSHRRRIAITGLLLAGLVVAGFIGLRLFSRRPANTTRENQLASIRSIAVLPLANLSGDASQEYFADGMTEAVITQLAKIGQLRVISRQSIMQYKSARKTTPQIARELNVDAVVQGSVLRENNRVRITAHLISAQNDEHLWSEAYERDLKDILALQGELARGIASQIKIKLTPQEQARFAKTRAVHPDAHEAYLNGLYWLNKAIDEPRTEEVEQLHKRSFEYFEQAIKFDPNYALAYSALAESYDFLASSGFAQFYPKAKEAALKSLALDDGLAQAHGVLAFTIWRHEWDFAGAERGFKRAEELAPTTYAWGYAQFLSTMGRHDEAIRKIRLAQNLDPLILLLKINVGWIYLDARRYDEAIAQFRSVLELDPKQFDAQGGLCTAYVLKGMHEEGIAECQRALDLSGETDERANLAWAYAMAGKRRQAIKILNDLKNPSKQGSISHLKIAMIYSALGEKDLGMAHLEKAYEEKSEGLLWLKVDPTFDGLRSDPRFQDLLRRMGLPQ